MNEDRRLGIIDFGTVALRLDVYQVDNNNLAEVIHRYRALPRLGEVLKDPEEFRNRVLREIGTVRKEADLAGARELLAVGTSAFRDLPNREALVQELYSAFGITLQILSGEEEAALTAEGILSQEPDLPREVALIDIGGGSTEVSFCRDRKTVSSVSLNIGCLSMKEALPGANVNAFLLRYAEPLKKLKEQFSPELVVGSSGTIRSIERVLSPVAGSEKPGRVYEAQELRILLTQLLPLSPHALLEVPGVEAKRADILIPGIFLFETVLSALGVTRFRVSHFSLRHGVLARRLRER